MVLFYSAMSSCLHTVDFFNFLLLGGMLYIADRERSDIGAKIRIRVLGDTFFVCSLPYLFHAVFSWQVVGDLLVWNKVALEL